MIRWDPWSVALAVTLAVQVWVGSDILATDREREDARVAEIFASIDPVDAYYGLRSNWYSEPCCHTLNAWR